MAKLYVDFSLLIQIIKKNYPDWKTNNLSRQVLVAQTQQL